VQESTAIWVVDSGRLREAQFRWCSPGGANVPSQEGACPHRRAHWCNLANTTEPSVCYGDAALCEITL